MDRQIVYSSQVPQTTDLLNTNKQTMIALAKLCADLFGTTTMATGLACVPTTPASMSVNVNPGQIYQLANVDGTAYSAIVADTTHSIVKQGILMDAQNFAITAPGTAGYSQNYLIQATYLDNDINNTVLPYYNSANPTQAFNGPGGNGTSQPTTRAGQVSLQLVAGTAAATGSQTTPAVTTGYVGLWVITVANGQSTITSSNIAQYAGAPFFPGFTRLDGSTPFTATQQGVTPAQFDNSTKLATTAYVMRAMGTIASGASLLSSNTTLTVAQSGTLFEVVGNPVVTLPGVSSTLSYMLTATSGGFTLTGGTIYFNGSSATSWTFPAGASIAVYCDGGSWIIVDFCGVSGTPTALDNSIRTATTAFANSIGGTVGSMRNAKMQVTAASATATFTADEIVVETALGGAPLRLASFNKSVNLGTVGAGGMDVGSAPVSGYVALYAIYNPTTGTAALLATNATSSAVGNIYGGANMPSGYTASALVSVWPTNSSGQFIIGYQRDRRISRNGVTVLNTNTAQASYTAVSAASAIPPNAVGVSGSSQMTSTSTGSAMTINMAGDANGSGVQNYGSAIPTGGIGQGTDFVCDVITSQTLYYQSTNTAGTPTYQITISRYEI